MLIRRAAPPHRLPWLLRCFWRPPTEALVLAHRRTKMCAQCPRFLTPVRVCESAKRNCDMSTTHRPHARTGGRRRDDEEEEDLTVSCLRMPGKRNTGHPVLLGSRMSKARACVRACVRAVRAMRAVCMRAVCACVRVWRVRPRACARPRAPRLNPVVRLGCRRPESIFVAQNAPIAHTTWLARRCAFAHASPGAAQEGAPGHGCGPRFTKAWAGARVGKNDSGDLHRCEAKHQG